MPLTEFNSVNATIIPFLNSFDEIRFNVMNLSPHSLVGMHVADMDQLFIVAKGIGWVCTEKSSRIPIKEGECVYWKKGEHHESGSDQGMTVYVLEGINFSLKT